MLNKLLHFSVRLKDILGKAHCYQENFQTIYYSVNHFVINVCFIFIFFVI